MPSAASKFCTNLREELWTPLPPVCRYIAVGVLALGLVIIMPSVLIGVSYADAPTESYCLKMNVHTREVEKKVEASSGRIYTGIEYTYVCYPRQIMNMEFSASNGNQLEARTQEGLNLGLDVSIEWRLKGSKIYELFEALNQDYVRLFESLALDSVRSAAGQFPALNFLSNKRANISKPMLETVNAEFEVYHAEAVALHLRHVDLPDQFESVIQDVEKSKLLASKAVEERKVKLLLESRKNQTKVIEELGQRNKSLVVKEADVERAKLQREAAITQFENDKTRKTLQAETARKKRLIEAQSTVNVTAAKRTAALTEAMTDQKRIRVELDTKVLKAQKAREAALLRANATAEATRIRAGGDAAVIQFLRAAELEQYKGLANSGAMNSTDILQYVWLGVLKGVNNAHFFVDYKKVPMFLESTVGAQDLSLAATSRPSTTEFAERPALAAAEASPVAATTRDVELEVGANGDMHAV